MAVDFLVVDDGKVWSIMAQLVKALMFAKGFDSEQTRNALPTGAAHQVRKMVDDESRKS